MVTYSSWSSFWIGGWQDERRRFQSWNRSQPAAVQGEQNTFTAVLITLVPTANCATGAQRKACFICHSENWCELFWAQLISGLLLAWLLSHNAIIQSQQHFIFSKICFRLFQRENCLVMMPPVCSNDLKALFFTARSLAYEISKPTNYSLH